MTAGTMPFSMVKQSRQRHPLGFDDCQNDGFLPISGPGFNSDLVTRSNVSANHLCILISVVEICLFCHYSCCVTDPSSTYLSIDHM